jgi:hypothetical protein
VKKKGSAIASATPTARIAATVLVFARVDPAPAERPDALATRMSAIVDAPQPLPVDVAVHLGRRQGRVAEQLLDDPQVGAALEQVRRERVAKAVWVRDEPTERRRVEPAPPD